MFDATSLSDFDAHEQVEWIEDPSTGLRAIIALHSTHLGPGAGGVRYWNYNNVEQAYTDALRLSRGMSYKNAMAGLPLGGGKAVILADPARPKSPELLVAFARAINALQGRYVTAQDVGMSLDDIVAIGTHTHFVSGLPPKPGEAGGDPGPATALGVFLGVEAAARHSLGVASLKGVHVAVQGTGSVGSGLARRLAAQGARVTVADLDADKAKGLARDIACSVVDIDEIMALDADIFSPCALGAILHDESISRLKVSAIAGGANNQLRSPEDADLLAQRGILYAPDYVINAGGIINVAMGYLGTADAAGVEERVGQIPRRLEMIWNQSEAAGENPARVADRMAKILIGRG